MGFSRQEQWSGLPGPSPGYLLNSGIKLASFTSLALTGGFFTSSATWEAPYMCVYECMYVYIHTHTHTHMQMLAFSRFHRARVEILERSLLSTSFCKGISFFFFFLPEVGEEKDSHILG